MLKPALTIMAGRSIGYAVLFVVPLILVRLFDQEQFGTYRQIFLLYATLLNLAQVGMSESLYYFLPGTSEDGGRYVCNTILVLGGIGTAVGALLVAESHTIAAWMNNLALEPLMPLLAVLFVLMLMSYVLEVVMTSRHQYAGTAAAYGLSDLMRAGLMVAPVLILQTVASVLYGVIVFAAIRLGATLWYCMQQFGADLRPSWPLLLRQAAYCAPFALYVFFHTGQESLHQFVVSSWFDAKTFAVYSVGCLQMPLIEVVGTSVCNVMIVGMVQAIRDGREADVTSMWHETVRKLAFVFVPITMLLVVAAHDLILLFFTQAYAASVPIFRMWSLVVLFAAVPMDGLLRVYAETKFLLAINIMKFIIVAAGMYWFVSALGLIGAVMVTVLALAAGKALGLIRMVLKGYLNLHTVLPWRNILDIVLIAGVAAVPAWWVAENLSTHLPARLVITIALYGVLYSALALMFGIIPKGERDRLLHWMKPRSRPRSLKTLLSR
jgi:O-antigen/teichoic acid export membrane protein